MTQPLVTQIASGFAWHLQPELARHLASAGADLHDWLGTGQATRVKQGAHRAVYRVHLDGLTFYVKHNRTPDPLTWLRENLRVCKARREFGNAQQAAARGIPTAEPLGWAQHCGVARRGESLFLTLALDDAHPLQDYLHRVAPNLPSARRVRVRLRLAEAFGEFMARMHQAGCGHDDLHAGNLMVRVDADDRPRLFLIDLTNVRFGEPLTWPRSADNLVVLNHWFIFQTSRADRLRFWRRYWQTRTSLAGLRMPAYRERACELEKATWPSLRQFWKRRDRRCFADNRYYRRLRSPHTVGHAVTDLDPTLLATLSADPDAPFRREDVIFLKNSATSTVVEFSGFVGGRLTRLIYKRLNVKRASGPWRSLMRMPPALHSWQLGQGMRERCLPTPRPLLVLHRRRYGLLHEGYLLTEKIEHAEPLHACLDALGDLAKEQHGRLHRARILKVAQAVRELHRRGLSQRDLKADNILLVTPGHETAPVYDVSYPGHNWVPTHLNGVWFVDLVGVSIHRRMSQCRRIQNLARLNASFHGRPELSRTDRLRFLRSYMQWALRGKEGWKPLWQAIAAATRLKLSRNERRGRPVA